MGALLSLSDIARQSLLRLRALEAQDQATELPEEKEN